MGQTYGTSETFELNAVLRVIDEGFTKGYQDAERATGDFEKTQQEMSRSVTQQTDAIAREATADMKTTGEAFKGAEGETKGLGGAVDTAAKEIDTATTKITRSAEEIGKSFQNAGKGLQEGGKTLSLAVTVPIAAMATAATAAWVEYDDAVDGIILATGASGEALEDLEQVYRNVFGGLPVESEKVAGAIGEINTQFGYTGEELEAATEQMVKYSEITGQDVVNATQGAKGIIEAYGLSYLDLNTVLDDVAKASQDTGADTGALMDQIISAAPQIDQLGLSTGEAAQLLGQLGQHGLDASNILGGLTRAQVEGAKSGQDLNEVLGEFSDYVASGASETDVLNRAAELFGTRRGPAMVKAAQQGVLDFDSLAEAAEGAGGTVVNTFEDTLDPIDMAQVAMNNFKIAAADVGGAIQVAAAPALEKLTEFAQNAVDKFRDLDTEQQNFIINLGAGLAAAGPAAVGIGKVASKIGEMADRASKAEAGTSKLGAALGGGGKLAIAAVAVAATVAIVNYGIELASVDADTKRFLDTQEKARESFEGTVTGAEENTAIAKDLTARLKELEGQTSLTADEQGELSGIIGTLNTMYPELNLAIDEETGLLNQNTEAIEDAITAREDELKLRAYDEESIRLLQEQRDIKRQLADQQEEINEKVEAGYLVWNEQAGAYETTWKNLGEGVIPLKGMIETYDALTEAEKENADNLASLAEERQEINDRQKDQAEELADKEEEQAERVSRATEGTIESWNAYQKAHAGTLSQMHDNYEWYIDEYGNLQKQDTANLERTQEEQRIIQENAKQREEDLQNEILANEEKWLDLRRTARETNLSNQEKYQSDLETELGNQLGILSAFAEDEFKSLEASAEQHYQHNKKKMEAYASYTGNMADLRGRVSDEMYAELEKMGPEHAGLIAEYAGMTEEELAKHSDQWVDIYETMGETAKTQVAEIPDVTAEELGKLEGIIRDEEGNIYNATTDALGYVTEAIRQEAPESESQMGTLVERVREKAKTDLSDRGEEAVSTYTDAMEDWRPEAEEQAIALALAVFENSDGSLEERGAEAVQTYVDAMAEAEIDAINQAMRMAREVEEGAKTILDDAGAEGVHTYIEGQQSKRAELEAKTKEINEETKEALVQDNRDIAEGNMDTYSAGIGGKRGEVIRQTEQLAMDAQAELSRDTDKQGRDNANKHADGFTSRKAWVVSKYGEVATSATNKLDTKNTAYSLGASSADAMAAGFRSKREAVAAAAGAVAQAIPDRTKSVLQFRSPPKVMLDIGDATGAALADSVAGTAGKVADAAETMTAPLRDIEIDTGGLEFDATGQRLGSFSKHTPTGQTIELHTHIADQDFRAFVDTVDRASNIRMERGALYA